MDIVCKNCGYLFNIDGGDEKRTEFQQKPEQGQDNVEAPRSEPASGSYSTGGYTAGKPEAPAPYEFNDPYAASRNDGFCIASLVLGIVGFLLGCCYGIGILPAIPGLIFGILGLRRTSRTGRKGKELSVAGIVLSSAAIVLAIVTICMVVYSVIMLQNNPDLLNDFNRMVNNYRSQMGS